MVYMRVLGYGLPDDSTALANLIANHDHSNDDVFATFSTRSERQELPGAMTQTSI
jgi:50S ribosomal subunit-associated GTPase HflX